MTPDMTERDVIRMALNSCNGDVKEAARLLTDGGWGPMSERTLYRRIDRYHLRPVVRYEVEGEAA